MHNLKPSINGMHFSTPLKWTSFLSDQFILYFATTMSRMRYDLFGGRGLFIHASFWYVVELLNLNYLLLLILDLVLLCHRWLVLRRSNALTFTKLWVHRWFFFISLVFLFIIKLRFPENKSINNLQFCYILETNNIVTGFFAVGHFAVKKMLVSVRLGHIRLGFFFTANCPTAKSHSAINSRAK